MFKFSSLFFVSFCLLEFLFGQKLDTAKILFAPSSATAKNEIGIIGYSPSWQRVNALQFYYPFLRGSDVVVGIKERRFDDQDIDLLKRTVPSSIASTRLDQHANVIASIIAGAGNTNYDATGIAQSAKVFSSSFDNLFADRTTDLVANNVYIQNHSYGTIIQSFYGVEAQSYDLQTSQQKQMLHVFSAGNSGQQKATEGKYANIDGYANLTGNFKMAKNVITVGAIIGNGVQPPNSSKGPLHDGRLAPHITALGPNGTSDAAAMVSGVLAVLQSAYKDSNAGQLPPASLLKAIVFNSAIDIDNPGIDFNSGFGRLNALGAAEILLKKQYRLGSIAQGASQNFTFTIPSNAVNLKVTMSYTDSVSVANNSKALLNDLDIQIMHQSSGILYRPWVLNTFPHKDSLQKKATTGVDTLNTNEQVHISNPLAGNYIVTVSGTRIFSLPIDFAIAYSVDTLDTFRFTNPLTAEDVNPSELQSVYVNWEAGLSDTNQVANLSVNIDGNWSSLSNVKLHQSNFNWPIPEVKGTVFFRMQTPFGTFFSPQIILHPQTRVKVDFNCTDSFRLSWTSHQNSSQYRLFSLIDSAYLRNTLQVSDTFVVMRKTLFPSKTYVVEPILLNGLKAIKSISIGIDQSPAQCFYKSFYYDLLPGNEVKLILELSTPEYVDSIYFEQIGQNGLNIKRFMSQKVFNNRLDYTELANNLGKGLKTFRAVLRTKSGALVYSEPTSVLLTGTAVVRYYPNPSRKGTQLKRAVQQGITQDKLIQFYTLEGRYIKGFDSIPDVLDTRLFPSGIIIYKLLDENGKMLESGRLLISE